MAEELEQNIRDNAAGPKQASADGVNVQQHDLACQIATGPRLQMLTNDEAGNGVVKQAFSEWADAVGFS